VTAMPVTILKMADPLQSLRKAVALCDGFAGLNRHDRVLVKPNVSIGFRMPPYGMTTTTSILEGLVQLLIEQGCSDISIAEEWSCCRSPAIGGRRCPRLSKGHHEGNPLVRIASRPRQ